MNKGILANPLHVNEKKNLSSDNLLLTSLVDC